MNKGSPDLMNSWKKKPNTQKKNATKNKTPPTHKQTKQPKTNPNQEPLTQTLSHVIRPGNIIRSSPAPVVITRAWGGSQEQGCKGQGTLCVCC